MTKLTTGGGPATKLKTPPSVGGIPTDPARALQAAKSRGLSRIRRVAKLRRKPKAQRLPRLRAFIKGLFVLVILVAIVVAIVVFWSVKRAQPTTDGEVLISGISAPVEVIRDEMGIPNIYAETTADLLFAQGYVHAQDRFFQMDVWRHIGGGRLAEMFGSDQVETDSFLRTLGWEALAEIEFEQMSDAGKEMLEAYAAGVNAYLEERSPAELAFEYTVLEITNRTYEVEPWTPIHTLTWGKVISWDLRGNIDEEINRALLLATLSDAQVTDLYPVYPDAHPTITGDSSTANGVNTSLRLPVPDLTSALGEIKDRVAAVEAFTGPAGDGIGSNSWVVSGEHTSTGSPLLANDPHLGIQLPSIWYEIGLHCTTVGPDCPFEVAGFSFPGAPGVVIGHNANIAWGFTNLGPDVMDLVIEKTNPDNSDQYMVDGEWLDMETRIERIEVAGGDPVSVEVRRTIHGPIISGTFGRLDDFDVESGIDVPEEWAIALQWTAIDAPARTFEALLGFNTASNWDEFRAAAQLLDVPAQNLVYADTAGNIGYQAPGRIPIRSEGFDGTVPVPGWTGEYSWTGTIPFAELPSSFNPPEGLIVTANNAIAPLDSGPFYTADWNLGYRARRIVDLLSSNEGLTIDQMAAIQLDTYDANAARLVPILLALDSDDQSVLEAQVILDEWNLHNEADSAGAAMFAATWRRILEYAFHDQLPEDLEPYGGSRWFLVIDSLLDREFSGWWDDKTTKDERESRNDILLAALTTAHADLTEKLGTKTDEWRWGELHTASFEHQTLGQSGILPLELLFNRGGFETGGGTDMVNATAWDANEGFEVVWLPSMRMIVDLGNLDRSRAIHTTGQSGHIYSDHHIDMADLWRTGAYLPMRWDRDGIVAAGRATLTMTPAPGEE